MAASPRIGIFGPSESGKTTLARELCREFWIQQHRRSIILDPNEDEAFKWPPEFSYCTNDQDVFDDIVKNLTRNEIIVFEDSGSTVARDNDKTAAYFTRVRHLGHCPLYIGHSATNLLPEMRGQINEVYLFRQPESSAKKWCEIFADKGLLESANLKQFEFIHLKMYGKPEKMKLEI